MSPPDEWSVLLKDRYPAYICWEQYQQNLARLKSNQARADELGAVRQGSSLLSGLLVCGFFGCRMTVQYHPWKASSLHLLPTGYGLWG